MLRREPQRRYPILMTLVAQSVIEVVDEVVQLFDQRAVSARESKAAHRMRDALAERAKSGEDRQALLNAILAVATDPAVPDEEVGGLIRGDRIGWERLRAAQATTLSPLPRDHGHLTALEASYGHLQRNWTAIPATTRARPAQRVPMANPRRPRSSSSATPAARTPRAARMSPSETGTATYTTTSRAQIATNTWPRPLARGAATNASHGEARPERSRTGR